MMLIKELLPILTPTEILTIIDGGSPGELYRGMARGVPYELQEREIKYIYGENMRAIMVVLGDDAE